MRSIHEAILQFLRDELEDKLIMSVPVDDPARAGAVKIGPLLGNPEIDAARIAVEVYQNDPDVTSDEYRDHAYEWEMPRTVYWRRYFSIIIRALLVETGESLDESLDISGILTGRIEAALIQMDLSSVSADNEQALFIEDIESEMFQGGGEDEYDWTGKIVCTIRTRKVYA